jgi:hypothetical protein
MYEDEIFAYHPEDRTKWVTLGDAKKLYGQYVANHYPGDKALSFDEWAGTYLDTEVD